MLRGAGRGNKNITAETGQVSSWLVKVVLMVAIVGFLLIEFGSVVVNRVQAGDVAGTAASEAGHVYVRGRNLDAAEQRAKDVAERAGAEFIEIRAHDRESAIEVTVEKIARTFVIHRIEQISDMTIARVTERAPLPR